MRFIEFKIRSFGLLENMEGHFPAGLSLILGDNESGKTTLMSFLRYSLFGCPDGRSNRNLYAPPHGGKQKGSLIIESLKGERFSLVMNGRNSTFSGARNGTSLEDLLGYVDREMYERIFAVGLEDMQKIRPLNDQGIQSRFFSAGAGLGTASLPTFLVSLANQEKALYRIQGGARSSAEINVFLKKIQETKEQIKLLQQQKDEYLQKKEELEKTGHQIESARKNLEALRYDLSLMEWVEKARSPWVEMTEAQRKLEEIGEVLFFPDEGLQRFKKNHEEEEARKRELEELVFQCRNLEKQLQAFHIPSIQKVLEQKGAIRALAQNRNRIEKEEEIIQNLSLDILSMKQRLDREVREIHQSWTIDDLESLDLSFGVSQKAGDLEKQKEDFRNQHVIRNETCEQARKARDEARSMLKMRKERVEKMERNVSPLSVQTLREKCGSLRQFFTRWHQIQNQIKENEMNLDLFRQKKELQWGGAAAGTLGLAFLGAGYRTGDMFFLKTGVTAIAAGLGFIIVDFFQKRKFFNEKEELLCRLRKNLAETEEELSHAVEGLAIECPKDYLELEKAEMHIDDCIDGIRKYDQALLSQRDAEEELGRRQRKLEDCESSLNSIKKLLDQTDAEWKSFVEEKGFSASLKVEHWTEFESLVKQLRGQLAQIRDMEKQLSSSQEYISAKEEEIHSLFRSLSLGSWDKLSLVSPIDILTSRLEEAEAQWNQITMIQREKKRNEEIYERAHKAWNESRTLKKELFEQAKVHDEPSFLELGERWQRCNDLKKIIENHRLSLLAIAGGNENLTKVLEELPKRTPAESQILIGESKEQEQLLSQQLEELNEERGHLKTRIDELEKDKELSALFLEREKLEEELRLALKEWLAVVACRCVLEQTRQKHEQERQPEVFKKAGDFLELMTEGRYSLISTASEEGGFSVELEEKSGFLRKKEDVWSSGLADQVYLSIRLALAELYGKRMEPLPLILDDVFVRFDERRQIGAARVVLDVASRGQILLFSCRRDIEEVFLEARDGMAHKFSTYEMKNGKFFSVQP